MKKIFIFVLLLLLVPAICLAEPQVTSDKQTFNPFTGVYDLQGNVHVEIGDRIITGDAAQVSMYKLEVHGQGNITLREGDITFDCDTVDVYGKEKTAYVAGNMNFTQGDMIISADTGSFNWITGTIHDRTVAWRMTSTVKPASSSRPATRQARPGTPISQALAGSRLSAIFTPA